MAKNQKAFPVNRLVVDAILTAMFFVFTLFSFVIAGVKVTLVSLPAVIAGMLFGPSDAFIVGFLGSFMEQMLRFGFTPTTLLWILPPAIQGMIIGFGGKLFRNAVPVTKESSFKKNISYYLICAVAALVTSLLNTCVYYIDSKMYGYYSFQLIFGVAGIRILTNQLICAVTATAAIPVLVAVRKTNLLGKRKARVSAEDVSREMYTNKEIQHQ